MVLIKGKEYITVAERINMLHEDHERVDILTEILSNDETVVLVKATIKIDDRIYTGHAHEIVGSNEVNQTSAIENAETSAVGRALAFAGIGVGVSELNDCVFRSSASVTFCVDASSSIFVWSASVKRTWYPSVSCASSQSSAALAASAFAVAAAGDRGSALAAASCPGQ